MSDYLDKMDELETNLRQLKAMIECTYAEQGTTFRNLNDEMQDTFLWTVADKIQAAQVSCILAHEAARIEMGYPA